MRDSVLSLSFAPEALRRLNKGAACFGGAALLALSAAMAPSASAQTASASTGLDASGNPKSEMAACRSGKTAQDRATCMKEVRNAQAARRAGRLENYGDQFAANALKRCEVFKEPDDLTACRARVEQGRINGSVAEGGILREAQTEVSLSPDMMQGTDTGTNSGSVSGSGAMPMETPTRPTPSE
jgi:hypothetical protein